MENLKNVAPIEDFNWDAYENGETSSTISHEDQEKAYDNTLNNVTDREVVDGTVIAMNKREVVVNIGYKSDGIIPMSEFRYNPDLKVGDTVEVYIENQEDKKGQLVLSHRKARAARAWERINAALENQEINIISLITDTINIIFSNFFSSIDNTLYGILDDITFITEDILNDSYMEKFLRFLTFLEFNCYCKFFIN